MPKTRERTSALALETERKTANPGRPWLWREDWAAGRIASNTRSTLKTAWTFAVLWNLASLPLFVVIPRELEDNPLAAIGFLFPVAGAGLLTWAVIVTRRWRRFGPSWFEMAPLPASPGGSCSGTVHTRLAVVPGVDDSSGAVTLKLTCIQRVIAQGGDNDPHEHIRWREERPVAIGQIAPAASGAVIPVHFELPADVLETTTVDQSAGIFWVLTVEAPQKGVSLKEEFEVPVYQTSLAAADSRPDLGRSFGRTAGKPITLESLAQSGIYIGSTSEGSEYRFAAARNVSIASGMTGFVLIWTGAIWLQRALGFPWIFQAVAGLVELFLIAVVVDLWLGSTKVTIGSGVVRTRHSILGLGTSRVVSVDHIARLDLHITTQTTGRSGTPYYELRATLTNGRHRSFGSGVRDKRQAEWLAAQMRSAIGLTA